MSLHGVTPKKSSIFVNRCEDVKPREARIAITASGIHVLGHAAHFRCRNYCDRLKFERCSTLRGVGSTYLAVT
jgi:hypothetical protein